MIDVTVQNFDAEVIEASMTTPVLVDFWAPWCGPCKVIGPLLEKAEVDYGGRFKLVKIDSDQQQELSQAFGIRSIPTCVLMMGGKPVDGFMGAVPEGQLKTFLDKHVPSLGELEAEADAEDAQALIAAGDPHAALHKLHEALAISHRVTVLRDGRFVGTVPTAEATKASLARMMVGREVLLTYEVRAQQAGEPRLRVEGVRAASDRGTEALRGINLEVRAGEILGLAGVSGNGQRELAEVIFGLRPVTAGRVMLDGQNVASKSPCDLNRLGMSYIPEERMIDGVIRDFTVAENLMLQEHGQRPYSYHIFMNPRAIARRCAELIRSFNIRTPTQETPIKSLSGGNIQKLVLARELAREPSVLIAAQPTRGVDIGATEYIHRRLLEQRAKGTATLLISEDLDEILALADRVAVIYEGEIVGVVNRAETKVETLGLMMAGVHHEAAAG